MLEFFIIFLLAIWLIWAIWKMRDNKKRGGCACCPCKDACDKKGEEVCG